MTTISTYLKEELSADHARQIAALIKRVWPKSDESAVEFARVIASSTPGERRKSFLVAWDRDRAVASAQTFSRRIRYREGAMEVMALAGVCVDPEFRGQGLGALVVREAFFQVDHGRYPIALFQTEIPEFYRKLGAVTVPNVFWDSTSLSPEKSPWWNKCVMIYPGDAAWPTGKIDLNGAAY